LPSLRFALLQPRAASLAQPAPDGQRLTDAVLLACCQRLSMFTTSAGEMGEEPGDRVGLAMWHATGGGACPQPGLGAANHTRGGRRIRQCAAHLQEPKGCSYERYAGRTAADHSAGCLPQHGDRGADKCGLELRQRLKTLRIAHRPARMVVTLVGARS
jgi:hypothetical protein